MDPHLIRSLLPCLGKHAFESFIVELFGRDAQSPFRRLEDVGEGAFYQPLLDSYGGSLHSVFLLHYLPIELLRVPSRAPIGDPALVERVRRVKAEYEGKVGYFGMVSPELLQAARLRSLAFLTNFAGIAKSEYENTLIPKYEALVTDLTIDVPIFVGSYDSFLEVNPEETERAFRAFVASHRDGIAISLHEEDVSVHRFSCGKVLLGGVLHHSKSPCEPLFVPGAQAKDNLLIEFETLIRQNAREAELERFLLRHYREIFGFKYDRIATQLWLSFPEIDVARKGRRLDLFLRNSVEEDWELFEIKRSIELTRSYRDVPVFVSEVTSAMQQLRNYASVLSQDSVRRKLAQEGIEYFYPSLRLVIGRTPQIPHRQWRWLRSTNERDLKIITFDELLQEMKVRLHQRLQLER